MASTRRAEAKSNRIGSYRRELFAVNRRWQITSDAPEHALLSQNVERYYSCLQLLYPASALRGTLR